MQYSPSLRRFRRTAQAAARAAGLLTARDILAAAGIPADLADRFAGTFTTAVKASGINPAATTWTKRNGRARATAAYQLGAALLAELLTYRPGGKPALLKNGKPSGSKKEKARQQLVREWTRALAGHQALALAA